MAAVLQGQARLRDLSQARGRRRLEQDGQSQLSSRVIAEVREQVRRRGLDPFEAPTEVAAIVEAVLNDLDQVSARTGSESFEDLEAVGHRILDAVAGFGVLQPLLDDDSIEEIWINGPDEVFVARSGESELTGLHVEPEEVRQLVERMLRRSGRRLDLSSPFVDASLPDGSRLHVVIPDVTREHWSVNIRKFVVAARRIADMVRLGSMSPEAGTFLSEAVRAGLNILVSGATDTQTEPHMFQQARRHANLLIHDLSSVSGACEDQCMNTKRKVRGIRAPSVRAGRSLGVVPHAHLCEGGIVRKTYLGFSLKHAAKRAQRALGRTASIQLGVS